MSEFKIDDLDALDGIFAWDNNCGSGVRNDEFKQYLIDNRERAVELLTDLCKGYLSPPNTMTFDDIIELVKWANDELDIY